MATENEPFDPRSRELCRAAVAYGVKSGASYVEARLVARERERLVVRDGRPDEAVFSQPSVGAGVRVLAGGAWGFAATPGVSEAGLSRAVDRAIAAARAAASVNARPVVFPEGPARLGSYRTPLARDPFAVSVDDKLAALLAPHGAGGRDPRVVTFRTWCDFTRVSKLLVTSEGSEVDQEFTYGGGGMCAVALGDDGRAQTRTYPGFEGSELNQGGYELFEGLVLSDHAERVRDEAVALLSADPCPAGTRTVLLESNQLALQVHESCGHPTELDRALGGEITLAGGSFLQPSMLGRLRYGSPLVNVTCDATEPGGLGTFGWDDEATPAGRAHLVRDGIFHDYLSSRETAAAIGRTSTGTLRAEGWSRPPIIRMVNVSLEPGAGSFADLVADTDDGILLATNKSWSIDDLRLNFQFGCEVAWEVKRGRRVRMLRDAIYTGVTPRFWGGCDAICGPDERRLWGVSNCGKGDPMQAMFVGHAASPARFRAVEVGHS